VSGRRAPLFGGPQSADRRVGAARNKGDPLPGVGAGAR